MSSRKLLLLLCLYIVSQHFTFSQVDSLILQKFANVPSVGEVFVLGQYENNCASASFLNKSYVSASFHNRFLLKELENEAVSGILRFHQNAFVFQVSHFGYAKYGDLTVAGAYARSLGNILPSRHDFTILYYTLPTIRPSIPLLLMFHFMPPFTIKSESDFQSITPRV